MTARREQQGNALWCREMKLEPVQVSALSISKSLCQEAQN
jgi:hypothetical protein